VSWATSTRGFKRPIRDAVNKAEEDRLANGFFKSARSDPCVCFGFVEEVLRM